MSCPNPAGWPLSASSLTQASKRPEDLADKTVIIVGLGGTSVDIARGLIPHAKQPVYISHRRGTYLLPRWQPGMPLKNPFLNLSTLEATSHISGEERAKLFVKSLQSLQNNAFPDIPEEWGLGDAPPLQHKMPILGDELYPAVKEGKLKLIGPIRRVVGESWIEVSDGQIIEADAIVFATGFKSDYSLLGAWDPSRSPPASWTGAKGSNGRPLPRWFMGVFSLDFPDSLANIETIQFSLSSTVNSDLASMAIAQVWAGNSLLPSSKAMASKVDADNAAVISLGQNDDVQTYFRAPFEWGVWADRMAGTGVIERAFGWGWKAWWFWLWDRKMYTLLRAGILSPHIWRLFDVGKRRPWSGARREIVKVNEMLAAKSEQMRQKA
jgi:dimethylaniline monooxygenase (N-oxide forming)